MNKRILYLLLLLPAILFQSCLKDDDDVFDEPSALRMANTLERTKNILTSSEYGWVFSYYPDRDFEYGGIAYTLQFDDQRVTVGNSLAPGRECTSHYKMTSDNGPVLSFDTYNELMHYYATPSSSEYEAKDGDFEFIIENITDDEIRLSGKRTRNVMYLRRLSEPAATYRAKASKIMTSFVSGFTGVIGGEELTGKFDLNKRTVYIGRTGFDEVEQTMIIKDTLGTTPFMFSDRGIEFYKPLTINGVTFERLTFDSSNKDLSFISSTGEQTVLSALPLPDNYTMFADFEGEYTLTYRTSYRVDVKLESDPIDNSYKMSGLAPAYTVKLEYDYNLGALIVYPQYLGAIEAPSGKEEDGLGVYLMLWALDNGGSLFISGTREGIALVKKDDKTFEFKSIEGSSKIIDSFFIGGITEDEEGIDVVDLTNDEELSKVGLTTANTRDWLTRGDNRIPYLKSLTRK